jgi:hypothetical protein
MESSRVADGLGSVGARIEVKDRPHGLEMSPSPHCSPPPAAECKARPAADSKLTMETLPGEFIMVPPRFFLLKVRLKNMLSFVFFVLKIN